MAPLATLTADCLTKMVSGIDVDKPILQILGSKKIASTEGSDRYRLLVSDGVGLYSFAMLGTQLNNLVNEGQLSDNSIVRINRYVTSLVNKSESGADKKVLIILDLDVLNPGPEVGKKIGTPVSIDANKKQQPTGSTNNGGSAGGSSNSSGLTSISSNIPYESGMTENRAKTTYNKNNNMDTSMNSSQLLNTSLSHPISSLSPYQNKWVIKVRVTAKTQIRAWNNAKGEGKLFSMDLMDESGEIRCTVFKEAVDRFYDTFEVGKVYFLAKGQLKVANKQFTSIKNDYEMVLNTDSIVQLCEEPVDSIPDIQYNLVPISQIANLAANTMIDVIGVCRHAGDVMQFTAKSSGRELKKREVTIVDTSNASVGLVLWQDDADNFDGSTQPVVLIKGARVTEFNGGKSISLVSGSGLKVNPDMAEGHKLRGWYDNGGANNITSSISLRSNTGMTSEWVTFQETKLKNLGNGDKADYFQTKAVIHLVKTGGLYKACPEPDCNKKVIDLDNEMYRCEKCAKEFTDFKYRIILQMNIGDWTSNRWVTCFSDMAEKILGKSAEEIGRSMSKEEQDAIFTSTHFKPYLMKLRTKVEYFGDSPRAKITVVSADSINYKEYNKYLIENIQRLTGIGKYTN